MTRKAKRVEVDRGGQPLQSNPFATLEGGSTPAEARPTPAPAPKAKGLQLKGRVDVRREKAGRGGKTVTVISGEALQKHNPAVRAQLLKTLQGQAGTGGTLKGANLELQGDHRDAVRAHLEGLGARVAFTGG